MSNLHGLRRNLKADRGIRWKSPGSKQGSSRFHAAGGASQAGLLLLEAYAAARYRDESLTQRQVGLLLGLDRWATEAFLRRAKAIHQLSLADYALERGGS